MPFVVKSIEETPNPHAMKFLLDRRIAAKTLSFSRDSTPPPADPLARNLLEIPGVDRIMFCDHFVTVGKRPGAAWKSIQPSVEALLASADMPQGQGF